MGGHAREPDMMISETGSDTRLAAEIETLLSARASAGPAGEADRLLREALRALHAETEGAPWDGAWPIGGGVCGALIRNRDWSDSLFGPVSGWSEALRTTISNIVHSPVPKVLMWGPEHRLLYNDAYTEILGARHPAAMGARLSDVWPELSDFNAGVLAAAYHDETVFYRDHPMVVRRNGSDEHMTFDLFYTAIREPGGAIAGVMCTILDTTGRTSAERALARSEAELRTITDALPLMVGYVDRDLIFRFVNRYYEGAFGRPIDTIIGRHIRDLLGESQYQERLPLIARALAGEAVHCDTEVMLADGVHRIMELRYMPRIADDGSVAGFHVLVLDVQDRVSRRQALEISTRRFQAAVDALDGLLWVADVRGNMSGEQPGWTRLTGQTRIQFSGLGWADAVHPDDRAVSVAGWTEAIRRSEPYAIEHRVRRYDGVYRTFSVRAVPVTDDTGEIVEWIGVHTDITHQRNAEASLHEQADYLARQVRHRQRAEDQLRQLNETLEARVIAEIEERRQAETLLAQAQKMETIGKLTGGVAHDFNNLLQVISGNLQLISRDAAGLERCERRVAAAMTAVDRGAKLASQLLAFGRRQPLEPKVVNVTRFVLGMDEILRRAIGEGIEIETVYSGGLWNTFIDPAQIENALLNLAINARDAMDGIGRLTIELANVHLDDTYARIHHEVEPGQYVMLAVSDTGCGMSHEVLERVFEPFFSTKEEGKGSGLGLSMVYGFVKQSGGHVKIYSELGHGTTIKLYLPRALQSEDREVSVEAGPIIGGSETVLVVEDDEAVRATVVEMLAELGYGVLKATDAQNALAVIESGIPIDLLFTDVVMPGTMKSPELARKARERLPNLTVLYTSGYTENSIVHGGRLDAGVDLLSKPYSREALARKIRHVLANQNHRANLLSERPGLASMLPGLPGLAEDKALTVDPVRPSPMADEASASRGCTVLLVEDDELIRTCTAEVLSDQGYTVVEAANANEAMMAFDARPIDVLVTDINLRGVSGPDLAAHTRVAYPGMAVVFASGDVGSVPDGQPFTYKLAKPYNGDALVEVIEQAIRMRATPLSD
jgi:PAS domain S-box-containing protein